MKKNIDRLEIIDEDEIYCNDEADVQRMLSSIKTELMKERDFDEYVELFGDE